MISVLKAYMQREEYGNYPHVVEQEEKRKSIRVVISCASCKPAESTVYNLLKGRAFGTDQPIELILFDFKGIHFDIVTALASQVVTAGFTLLTDVIPTDDPEIAFKDVDVAILLTPGHSNWSSLTSLNYNFHLYKNLANTIDRFANKAKILIVGDMTPIYSMVFAEIAKSVPKENITGLSQHVAIRAYSTFSKHLRPNFRYSHGIHVFGIDTPDLTNAELLEEQSIPAKADEPVVKTFGGKRFSVYSAVKDCEYEKRTFSEGVENMKWTRMNVNKDLQFRNTESKDYFIGSSICSHLKSWWQGTTNPVSMIVASDGSYSIEKGLFSSLPVTINRNKNWKIVKGLKLDTGTYNKLNEDNKYLIYMRDQIMIFMMKEEVNKLIRNKTKSKVEKRKSK